MPRWLRSMFGSDFYDDRYQRRKVIYTDSAYYGSSAGRTVTTTSQVCSACGRFRSPSWSARHPLRYGEVPRASMCRKCVGKSTSSEQSACPRRRRGHHHHHSRQLHSEYTDDPYSNYDSRDPYHLRRRYRSDSLGYIRPRSLVRSGSGERVNIIIQNEGTTPKTRVRTLSSSDDFVRATHRVSVDQPVRRRVLRSVSLDPLFADEDVEEVLSTRRPLRRARTRSRSSVHFVDEFDEPYYRRRPRSPSRHSSVEEVIASRPRRYSRRHRPVHVDGAADARTDDAKCNLGSAEESVGYVTSKGEKNRIAEPLESSKASGCRQSSNLASVKVLPLIEAEEACLAPKSSQSTSPASLKASHLTRFAKRSQSHECSPDKSDVSSDAAVFLSLNDRARVAFADYDYEVDSQFSSPPPVKSVVPVNRQPRSLSPLRIPTIPIPRISPHDHPGRLPIEAYGPVYSSDREYAAVPLQTPHERLSHSRDPLSPPESNQDPETPPTSFTSSEPRPDIPMIATMTAEDPNHPDHLAYLLSSAQIAPSSKYNGNTEETQEQNTGRPSQDSHSLTPRHDRDPSYYGYAKTGSMISSSTGSIEKPERLSDAEVGLATADRLASSMDDNSEEVDQEFCYHERLPGRNSLVDDIFDEAELERLYCETEVDYDAERKAQIQNMRRQKAMQKRGAIHQ